MSNPELPEPTPEYAQTFETVGNVADSLSQGGRTDDTDLDLVRLATYLAQQGYSTAETKRLLEQAAAEHKRMRKDLEDL